MAYKLQTCCTVGDAAGVAKTNVAAFWTQTWWRILFDATEEQVTQVTTARTPQNLLAQRDVRRHQAVVDEATGDIVGYARWILPAALSAEWPEAQTPAVPEPERKRLKALFDDAPQPFVDNMDEMDELDEPITENQEEFEPEGAYLKLDYLATRPDHQRRGISEMLVRSGMAQADRLGVDIMVTAMGEAATGLYKKLGFEQVWELSQSLQPFGHEDVYYTAILLRRATK
jgi:ribosomal protein S18 acetylase RimI-like enzyme